MNPETRVSRRGFLKVSAASAAVLPAGAFSVGASGAQTPVRVAVIGCGSRGAELLDALRSIEDCRVAVVCDADEPRAKDAAARCGAKCLADWRAVFERGDVDGVVIATPDHLHAFIALALMESGKDIYCEPPMALTIDDARAIEACARRTARVLQVGVQALSRPEWALAAQIIKDGTIGKVRWCQGRYGRNGNATEGQGMESTGPAWQRTWQYSMGSAASWHYSELAPMLMATGAGLPARVSAAGGVHAQDGRETPDALVMTAEYHSGMTAVVASSAQGRTSLPPVIRGTEGRIYVEQGAVRLLTDFSSERVLRVPGNSPRGDHENTVRHLRDWLQCIRTRERCACDAAMGYRTAVPVIMAARAYRNAKTLCFDARTGRFDVAQARA